jgi:hypothetical protein
MKRAIFSKTILALFVVLTAAVAAFPCRCVPASLQTYYKRADAVVTAKVLSVSTSTEGDQLTTVELEVIDAWKKDLPKEIKAITGSSCIYIFQVGEKHLLYLKNTPTDEFSTMRCQGNLPLNKAQKSLNWLKKYGKKSNAELSSVFLPDLFEERLSDFLFETETVDCNQTGIGEIL